MWYFSDETVLSGGKGQIEYIQAVGWTVESTKELFKEFKDRGAKLQVPRWSPRLHTKKCRLQVLLPASLYDELRRREDFCELPKEVLQILKWHLKLEQGLKWAHPEFREPLTIKYRHDITSWHRLALREGLWADQDSDLSEVLRVQEMLDQKYDLAQRSALNIGRPVIVEHTHSREPDPLGDPEYGGYNFNR